MRWILATAAGVAIVCSGKRAILPGLICTKVEKTQDFQFFKVFSDFCIFMFVLVIIIF